MKDGLRYYLNGEWALSFTHPETHEKINTDVTVPCNIEPTLAKLGLVEDWQPAHEPYATQIFEAVDDWTYTTVFAAPQLCEGYTCELVFEGIDTVAEVYLNGVKILDCEDMHIAYRVDVSGMLRDENRLCVAIRSSELWARKHPHDMIAFPRDGVTTYDSQSYLRKARHQWGWDNAPRLLTSGIVRDVYIEQKPPKRFEEVYLYTDKITESYVILGANWIYTTSERIMTDHRIRVTLLDGEEIVHTVESRALFTQGSFKYVIDRDKIKLWWPQGFGEPHLYRVRLEMLEGGSVSASYEAPFGVRTLSLDWSEYVSAEEGGRFDFLVNGEKIYVRGTNWKPLDPLVSLADAKLKMGKALEEIVALNCNMVRIWGGGIYEDEFFFDYCDRQGIMVWQDFMFACEVPPTDDGYCALVAKEAEFIVKKYRNHPSLAVWCGDNEDDECMLWGGSNTTALPSDIRVSRDILKKAVIRNDPYRTYVPSSPFLSDVTVKERRAGMETHFGTEKHLYCELYDQPAALRQCASIFLGETGPFWTNAMTADRAIFGRETARAKRLWDEPVTEPPVRNEVIFHQDDYYFKMWRQSAKRACEHYYGRDFGFEEIEDFTLALNVLCAETFKDLIEYCRVSSGKTGVIWWSLMDMWPMLFNYSVIDCNGTRKLPYYWIKHSQQEIALMGVRAEIGGDLDIYAVNDTREDSTVAYTVKAYGDDMTSRTIASGRIKQRANSAGLVQKIAEEGCPQMWIIKWSCDGKSGVNHVFTGIPAYETVKKWVEILESEYAPTESFSELELLKK